MISRLFNLFDPLSILQREVLENLVHKVLLRADAINLACIFCDNLLLEQSLEPDQFYVYSEANQGKLRVVRAQRVAAAGVSSIDRTDCGQARNFRDLCAPRREHRRRLLEQDTGLWAQRVNSKRL